MAKSNLVVLALLFALVSVTASAFATQQTVETPGPQTEGDILVVGQRTREAIQAFVSQMSIAPPRHNNQLARWDRSICPGVAGLRARYAQFVIDRMAQRALDVGLNVGQPGCRANILIVVSPDPDAIARDLYRHSRLLMGAIQERGHVTLGSTALAAFVNSDAPVRWWHVARMVTRDGDVIGDALSGRGDAAPMGSSAHAASAGVPVMTLGSGNSMLWRSTHQNFGVAFIIVDARQLSGISFEALADYLAMVTFAQLDPTAQTEAYPTILNLFHPQTSARTSAPAAMTDWDVAYLRGLYGATADARNANQQQGEISASMSQSLVPH